MDVALRYLEQGRALAQKGEMDSLRMQRMEGMYRWAELARNEEYTSELTAESKKQWEQARQYFAAVYTLTESRYRRGKATAREAYEAAQHLHWIEMYIRMLRPHADGAEQRAQQRILKAARKYAQRLEREAAEGCADRAETLRAERCLLQLSLSVGADELSAEEREMVAAIRRNFEEASALANARYKNESAPFRTVYEISLEQLRFELYLHLRCGESRQARRTAGRLAKESAEYYRLLERSEASVEELLKSRLLMLSSERTAEQLD